MSFLKKLKSKSANKRPVIQDRVHDKMHNVHDCITPDCRSDLRQGSNHQYIPIETNHGPGLYRNHTWVHGDSLRTREYNRTYIYHRPAFDWYRNDRWNLIDDIEEILAPGHQQHPKFDVEKCHKPDLKYKKHRRDYGHNEYRYNANDTYARRTRNRCRSYEPVYHPEPKSEPVYYPEPQPEPVSYTEPKPVEQPTYSNVTSIKSVQVPKYTGPEVVYHGNVGNPKEYNQDFSLYRSKSLNNSPQYTNYQTTVDRSAYVSSVKNVDQDYARRILLDLQRLEREGRQEKAVHFGHTVSDKYQNNYYE